MDPKEITKFCIHNGLLIDKEVLSLLSENSDLESAKLIITKIKSQTKKKIITKELFEKDKKEIIRIFSRLPVENQAKLQKLKVKLGIKIEISKEITAVVEEKKVEEVKEKKEFENKLGVKVLSSPPEEGKKYVVQDFVNFYRERFSKMRELIRNRRELRGLVSINKVSNASKTTSVIGIVSDKRITKNNNLLFEIEDMTGKIRVLVNQNKKELFEEAKDISLDSVIGFVGNGNSEIIFANNFVYPDASIPERKKSPVEEYALFLGDLQIGSKISMEKDFSKFIKYLNGEISNDSEISKIKYIFLVGDIVEGVGVFPNQENELTIKDLESQFSHLAELLGKIRKDITIIISPGNHDGVRLAEPQPFFDEKYAWPIYNLKNVIMTPNPAMVNIGARGGFEGFNVLTYHGFSYPYYSDNVPSFVNQGGAMNSPNLIMKYLLKYRHLAPTHGSNQHLPSEEDSLIIEDIPDIFVSGHTHKMDIKHYRNILLISTATWEKQNKFQERMGNKPDFCKVPMLNLKTREIKILDFYNPEQEDEIFAKEQEVKV